MRRPFVMMRMMPLESEDILGGKAAVSRSLQKMEPMTDNEKHIHAVSLAVVSQFLARARAYGERSSACANQKVISAAACSRCQVRSSIQADGCHGLARPCELWALLV